MINGIGLERIVLQEIKHTCPKHFESDAHVAVVVEPIQHRHAQVFSVWIIFGEFVEHIDLQFGSVLVLSNVFDNLDGDNPIAEHVEAFDDLAKSPLAEHLHQSIPILQDVSELKEEMTVLVIVDQWNWWSDIIPKSIIKSKPSVL